MKVLVQQLNANSIYSKLFEWGKLLTISGSAQVVVQAVGVISSILIIRLLSTQEYALYTLANTMLGTMTLLADGGITAGVMSQGGKVWQDKMKLGAVVATGINLRKKFALGSLIIAVPMLMLLLHHHGASLIMSSFIVLALIPAFFSALSGQLLSIGPSLHQNIVPIQKIQVGVNIGRLLLTCLSLFAFPLAFIAILAAGLPQIWANRQLYKISSIFVDAKQAPDPLVQKEIIAMIKRILPGVIYYCFSGQITIWLISVFGSTDALAQIGALGRLAMMISLFSVLFNTLISPRFARLPNNSSLLLRRYIQIQVGLLFLCIGILLFVWLFPTQVLWILGKSYIHLQKELLLIILGNCLTLIAGCSFTLYISRGWAINPILSIPLNIITISVGAALLDVSTLMGILLLNILVAAIQILMNNFFTFLKIIKLKVEPTALGVNYK